MCLQNLKIQSRVYLPIQLIFNRTVWFLVHIFIPGHLNGETLLDRCTSKSEQAHSQYFKKLSGLRIIFNQYNLVG